jgi:glyoxylase-like metal-dependent hydrolase (beta-lactamase superfamily II)
MLVRDFRLDIWALRSVSFFFYPDTIHTPGHTKGSMSFRLTISDNANYLFTGDLLFVDGIGRPDLHDKAEEFAGSLFKTRHERILNLPDETIILPAHFSGSFEREEPVFGSIGSIRKSQSSLWFTGQIYRIYNEEYSCSANEL